MNIAELIEKLQEVDPQEQVMALWFTRLDFENSDTGEVCTPLAFASAVTNAEEEMWVDSDYVLGEAVHSAMGWIEEDPNDPCRLGCVCGGNNN
jgi:hypothetical protein